MAGQVLIVGGDGFLGSALRDHLTRERRAVAVTSRRDGGEGQLRFDLAEPVAAWPPLPSCQSAILCAGMTNLAWCSKNPEAAHLINVSRTVDLARKLVRQGAFVVYLSTNFVFDGSRPNRSAEEPTCPVTTYGAQKAEVEALLAEHGLRVAIVRLAKVFHRALPVVRDWVGALENRRMITAFDDLVCAPVPLSTTVQGLATIAARETGGIWQFSPAQDISYVEIARVIARAMHRPATLVQPASARGKLEHLPRYTTLDATRASRELGLDFPAPERAIVQALAA